MYKFPGTGNLNWKLVKNHDPLESKEDEESEELWENHKLENTSVMLPITICTQLFGAEQIDLLALRQMAIRL